LTSNFETRKSKLPFITALYRHLPVTESVVLPPDVRGLHHERVLQTTMSKVQNHNDAGTDHPRRVRL
jgi:hypothetical protein